MKWNHGKDISSHFFEHTGLCMSFRSLECSSNARQGVRIIVSSINLILKRVYLEIMVLYLNSGGVRLYIGVYFILGDSLNCPKSSSTNNDGPGKLA